MSPYDGSLGAEKVAVFCTFTNLFNVIQCASSVFHFNNLLQMYPFQKFVKGRKQPVSVLFIYLNSSNPTQNSNKIDLLPTLHKNNPYRLPFIEYPCRILNVLTHF